MITFKELYRELNDFRKELERFNPRGCDSKRQMRRARGKWKTQRRLYWAIKI